MPAEPTGLDQSERDRVMRTWLWLAATVLLCCSVGFADDAIKPEQLKKMYDDALAQLKSAQDRKAELARENEVLGAKLQEVQKQLAATQEQVQSLKREIAQSSDRSYVLLSYQNAWKNFLRHHPDWLLQWKLFLSRSVFNFPAEFPDSLSYDWSYGWDEMDSPAPQIGDAQTAGWHELREPADLPEQ